MGKTLACQVCTRGLHSSQDCHKTLCLGQDFGSKEEDFYSDLLASLHFKNLSVVEASPRVGPG